MSKLNPLSDIEKPLLRLVADLETHLSPLPGIEREIVEGFAKTNELLARVIELLEESNAAGAVAPTNGRPRRATKT